MFRDSLIRKDLLKQWRIKQRLSIMREVVIVSSVRTPFGRLGGVLKDFTAPQLGGYVISEALKRAGIEGSKVDEVIFGTVIAAGQGQVPARQASEYGGIPVETPCLTINKVCGSGLRAVNIPPEFEHRHRSF